MNKRFRDDNDDDDDDAGDLEDEDGGTRNSDSSSSSDDGDDGNQRKYRKRLIPHIEGLWVSSVFITLNIADPGISELQRRIVFDDVYGADSMNKEALCSSSKENIESANNSNETNRFAFNSIPLSELHISVSRILPLQLSNVQAIEQKLKKVFSIAKLRKSKISLEKKRYLFLNEDGSTLFASSLVTSSISKKIILAIIKMVDSVLMEEGFAKYFDDPKPHVSFGWCTNFSSSRIKQDMERIHNQDTIFENDFVESNAYTNIELDKVIFKTGSVSRIVYQFPVD